MTSPAELRELAARAEAATGPDRELMCAAFKGAFPEVSSGAWDAIDAWDGAYDRFCAMLAVGAYESAALSLVPEGWSVGIGHLPGMDWLIRAHLRDHREQSLTAEGHSHIWVEGHHKAFAAALTAAALRARALSQEQTHDHEG